MKRLGEVKDKVFAVAMSDSVHGAMPISKSPEAKCFKDWFKEVRIILPSEIVTHFKNITVVKVLILQSERPTASFQFS